MIKSLSRRIWRLPRSTELAMRCSGSLLVGQQTSTPPLNPIELPFPLSIPRKISPPELPQSLRVDVDGKCIIEYIDVKPKILNATTPTVVVIHGTPGTYRDFRHLIPLLKGRGVRVIGVNIPGSAGSTILDTSNYYKHISSISSAQLTLKALQHVLKDSHNVFMLGHSFGSHTAVHLTAFNDGEQKIQIKGLVFFAGAGHRPHRALKPRFNDIVYQSLQSGVPIIESIAKWFTRQLFLQVYKFPDMKFPNYFTTGIVRCATADYELYAEHLKKNQALPSFLAWAKNDIFLEEEIVLDVSAECHPGPRLAFKKGGHNIQKTRATVLAAKLTDWMNDVIEGKGQKEAYSTEVETHP